MLSVEADMTCAVHRENRFCLSKSSNFGTENGVLSRRCPFASYNIIAAKPASPSTAPEYTTILSAPEEEDVEVEVEDELALELAAVAVPLNLPVLALLLSPVAVAEVDSAVPVPVLDLAVAQASNPTVAAVYVCELAERAELHSLLESATTSVSQWSA